MAGQPRKRAFLAALDDRAREHSEGDPSFTHLDYACAWVQSGRTLVSLSRVLFEEAGLTGDPLPDLLANYLRTKYGDDYIVRMKAARAIGAHAKAEETEDIAAEPVLDSAGAARARNRIAAAQFLAERWNREELGRETKPGVVVNLSAGTLHLEAMRARAFTSPASVPALPAESATATGSATGQGSSLPSELV